MCCLRLPSISDIHSQKFAKIHSTEYSDVTNKTISTFNNLARELQPMLFLSNGWNGKIDEVAVWNTALTATDVQNIYNATTTGKTADLSSLSPVAWYRMGD